MSERRKEKRSGTGELPLSQQVTLDQHQPAAAPSRHFSLEAERIFFEALDKPAENQRDFVVESCGDRLDLRQEVASLLEAHEKTGPLDRLQAKLHGWSSEVLRHGQETTLPTAPTGSRIRPNDRLGHYEIRERLGMGGMGEVVSAHDQVLGREVAIKLLHSDVSSDPDRLARFEREARVLAALNHPNIATLFGFEQEDDISFLVMELVEGETLAERLARGPMPLEEATTLFLQIANGLEAAHQKGVIHRDLKPANVKIDRNGVAKILDFGIAKPLSEISLGGDTGTDSASAESSLEMTHHGDILGTAPYMSPEQARGDPVDQQSDIFAFGSCLFEALTGHSAFEGKTPGDTLQNVLVAEPEFPASIDHDSELRHFLERCQEIDRGRRYQDFGEVTRALRHLGNRKARRRRRAEGLLIAVTLILTVWGLRGLANEWRATGAATGDADIVYDRSTIAIVPFDQVGQVASTEFAHDLSLEITQDIARSPDLDVIAPASAMLLREGGRSAVEVGRELGTQYVLAGEILWKGEGLVRVSPRLYRVADGVLLWEERFEGSSLDGLGGPTEIGSRVREQLNLSTSGSGFSFGELPTTTNSDAYFAYLRGLEAAESFGGSWQDGELALRMFERAVELDPGFVSAWSELSVVHYRYYTVGWDRTPQRLEAAREAAQQAQLHGPEKFETRFALGCMNALLGDLKAAARDLEFAARGLPNDVDVLLVWGDVEQRLGKFETAIELFERAARLDPRSMWPHSELAMTLTYTRDYARADRAYHRAMRIAPDVAGPYAWRAWNLALWKGWEAAARVELPAPHAPDEVNVWPYWVNLYLGRFEDALSIVDELGLEGTVNPDYLYPSPFLRAQVYDAMGEAALARAEWQKTVSYLEARFERGPTDARHESALGIAYSALGQKQLAISHGERGVDLKPISADALAGSRHLFQLAEIHARLGDTEKALSLLDQVLSIPGLVSITRLEAEPEFESVRQHPGYQRLVAAHGQTER